MNKIYDSLLTILESKPHEEDIHQFLIKHPYIIANLGFGVKRIFSKPNFGKDFIADFALAGWGNYLCWTFVEIERSDHKLFTKEGLIAQPLNRAIAQINSWWIWLHDHSEYASKEFYRFSGEYTAAIVIGRRSSLSNVDIRRLEQLNQTQLSGKLKIITYDVLLDYAKDNQAYKQRDYMKFKSIKEWADYCDKGQGM